MTLRAGVRFGALASTSPRGFATWRPGISRAWTSSCSLTVFVVRGISGAAFSSSRASAQARIAAARFRPGSLAPWGAGLTPARCAATSAQPAPPQAPLDRRPQPPRHSRAVDPRSPDGTTGTSPPSPPSAPSSTKPQTTTRALAPEKAKTGAELTTGGPVLARLRPARRTAAARTRAPRSSLTSRPTSCPVGARLNRSSSTTLRSRRSRRQSRCPGCCSPAAFDLRLPGFSGLSPVRSSRQTSGLRPSLPGLCLGL